MPNVAAAPASTLIRERDHWHGRFMAMASPCELLVEGVSHKEAAELFKIAASEAARIERKFSRYRADSVIQQINTSNGQPVEVDDETANLLDYAAECWTLSDGLFDITSGVLRKVWKFDGTDRVPLAADIELLLPRVGWEKIEWKRPLIVMPAGMELDFGGIGKEYAVDTTAALLRARTPAGFVVNFGGDLYVSGLRSSGKSWIIGVDDPNAAGEDYVGSFSVARGGVATSGDARRFLLKDGVRYSHILNPKTGWPVTGAPRSVTVVAETCVEAGILSTMAMLQGSNAETFLRQQAVRYWTSNETR